ncbi:MAG TPA: plasmid pRiA4b ORF-3 family protein [Polyangiaceae bacterium]|nr:plasmid pRiA4b ORF-3 family protein [Polyangiaceae bacterium]
MTAIWRTVVVPAEMSLGELHEVLQIALGWQDSHLHDFEVGEIRFGMVDVEDELFAVDEQAAPLGAVAREGSSFTYRYDFGDDWEHDVVVESVIANGAQGIVCSGGARACPPEDSGGTHGYANLLGVLANPDDDQSR